MAIIKISKKKIDLDIELALEILSASSFIMLTVMKLSSSLKSVLSIIEILIGVIILIYFVYKYRASKALIVIISLLLFSGLLNLVFVKAISVRILVKMFLVHLPISLVLLKNKKLNPPIWLGCFIFLALFLLYRLFYNGYYIFYDTSRNYISMVLIISAFIYEISLKKNDLDVNIFIPFIILISSIVAQGRGGIISSILLFVLYIFFRYFVNVGGKKDLRWFLKIIFLCAVFIILLIYLYINFDSIINQFFPRFTFQQSKSTVESNETRVLFYTSYFNGIKNIKNFMLGFNLIGTSWVATHEGGNIHNSYLQVHSYLGLTGFVIFVVGFFRALKSIYLNKQYLFFVFAVGFLLRIGTDFTLPGGVGDIIFWYVIFMNLSCFKNTIEK